MDELSILKAQVTVLEQQVKKLYGYTKAMHEFLRTYLDLEEDDEEVDESTPMADGPH